MVLFLLFWGLSSLSGCAGSLDFKPSTEASHQTDQVVYDCGDEPLMPDQLFGEEYSQDAVADYITEVLFWGRSCKENNSDLLK